jgi:hypothetical protein
VNDPTRGQPKDGIDFRRCRPVGGAYHEED